MPHEIKDCVIVVVVQAVAHLAQKNPFDSRCLACGDKRGGADLGLRHEVAHSLATVSYTHLTLPTICSV
eukprot:3936596-Alexandrium_andersonii.AAC.1